MFRIDRSRVNISEIRELQMTLVDGDASTMEHVDEQHIIAHEPLPDPYEIAEAKAQELLDNATREAEAMTRRAGELLQKAETDAEALKTEAMHQGFEDGFNEGRAEGEQQYNTIISEYADAFSGVISDLKRAGDTMISEMESDIIDLCFSVLRKITAFDRATDGEIYKSVIKKAISQVDLTGKVAIRLSHDDFERFFPNGEAIFDINDTEITAVVSSDPEFADGDIAVDTDSETVIAGAETQLRSIEIAFKHRIGKDNG